MNTIDGPTVISLFAGCGGSSLGYRFAGFRELLAVDFDKHAVETFAANFPGVPVWRRDVSTVTVEEILEATKLAPGELDILDGSPPCQGFSLSNVHSRANDPRNHLFLEYVRILRGLKPKAFIMENVPGQLRPKHRATFKAILNELRSSGYRVGYRVLNAAAFGVPTRRERLIYIGVREDLEIDPSFPVGKGPIVSMREALIGVKPDATPELNDGHGVLYSLVPVTRSASYVKENKQRNPNFSSGWNGVVKPSPLRPLPTLPKTNMGTGFATLCHWSEPRALSVNELKRLCSFPDDFILEGSFSQRCSRLGNSVMPRFMEALARHVRATVLERSR
jgi:DNA (cytosine-5)-methyltransferase 1